VGKYITNFYIAAVKNRRGVAFSIFRFIASFFSVLYYAAVEVRAFLRDTGIIGRVKLSCTVISVGNITAGGTGKTPAVLMIAKALGEKGKKVGVLTRGYGRTKRSAEPVIVSEDSSPDETGEEPLLILRELPSIPVIVCKNRKKSGKYAIEKLGVDTLILDDGFQYTALKRDIDIVTIDALAPFSNGRLIPSGLLREPLSGLARADMFLLTRADQAGPKGVLFLRGALGNINAGAAMVETVHFPVSLYSLAGNGEVGTGFLKGKEVALLASTGNPASFEITVAGLGAKIEERIYFPDHYRYKEKDMADIERRDGIIVTTQKDEVRLKGRLEKKDIFVLGIEMRITKGKEEWEKIMRG